MNNFEPKQSVWHESRVEPVGLECEGAIVVMSIRILGGRKDKLRIFHAAEQVSLPFCVALGNIKEFWQF